MNFKSRAVNDELGIFKHLESMLVKYVDWIERPHQNTGVAHKLANLLFRKICCRIRLLNLSVA